MSLLRNTLLIALAFIATFTISFDANAQRRKKKKKPAITEATLENTHWRLFQMNNKPVITPADSKEVYFKLGKKKETIEGYTGCNLITGSYIFDRDGLSFEAGATERYCEGKEEIENYIMTALNKANRHEINGLYLLLFDKNYLLAIFEAKYYDE